MECGHGLELPTGMCALHPFGFKHLPTEPLQAQAKFEEDGSVQLQSFLKTALANRILGATAAADAADGLGCGRPPASHVVGTGCGWSAVGPPHKQRFLRYTAAAAAATHGAESTSVADTPGELLEQVREMSDTGVMCGVNIGLWVWGGSLGVYEASCVV
eukprot:365461-Chlamydomonas_euryale.AAC.7